MRVINRVLFTAGFVGGIAFGGAMTANAQYYPPPPYGYGYGGRTYNGCPPGYTVQGGVCQPYRGPAGVDGGPITAARPVTQSKAASANPIAAIKI
jgi:hypothetical protein